MEVQQRSVTMIEAEKVTSNNLMMFVVKLRQGSGKDRQGMVIGEW